MNFTTPALQEVIDAAARLNVVALSDAQLMEQLKAAQQHNPATGFLVDCAAAVAISEERKRRQEARRVVAMA